MKSLFLKSPPTLLGRATQGSRIRKAVNVEQKRVRPVKERAMDLHFELADGSSLQTEVQAYNHSRMEWRMLDHRAEAALGSKKPKRLRQIVIYVGKQALRMRDRIEEEDLSFRYHLVDIRDYDAEELLRSTNASDVVMALRAGGIEDRRMLAERVARRANALPEDGGDSGVTVVVAAPGFCKIVKEAIMGLNLDWRDNEVLREWHEEDLRKGREEGLEEGRKALRDTLLKVIAERFGKVPRWASAQIRSAEASQLSQWIVRAVRAKSIETLIGRNS